jgi:hypothetical protein
MDRERPGWFATLRRDRTLFAWLGAFVLILNLLQPWAAAGATGIPGVICTLAGKADGSIDPAKCPICLAGNHCPNSVSPGGKALPPADIAPRLPRGASLPIIHPQQPARERVRLDHGSNAIRAPPFHA